MDDLPKGLAESGAIEISQVLGGLNGGRVLDVGTGDGELIAVLIEFLGDYSDFTGIDLDPEKLEKARDRLEGKPVHFLEMDGGDMAFDDGTFDTVCISHSLHHLDQAEVVMAEMLRVLRPGGTFLLQEMFSDGEQSPSQAMHIRIHHWSARVDTLLGTFHRRTYSRVELLSIVDLLELRDVRSFETTHGVKCLTCEDRFRCEDPLDPEFVRSEKEDIEKNIKRLDASPDREHTDVLQREGGVLMDDLLKTGCTSASTMFVIGRK